MKKIALVILILTITGFVVFIYNPSGEIEVNIDGEYLDLEDPVKTGEDILFVPAKLIFEELGFQTEWDAENKILSASLGDFRIDLPVGSQKVTVNGKIIKWDNPVEMFDDIVYMPVSAAVETLGAFVEWDESSRVINILTPQEYFDPEKQNDQEGPVLKVAYPPAGRVNYYGHSLFVFGTTQSFSEVHVTVNGEPVDILDSRTGNFLTMVDIPRGEEFPIIVKATDSKGATTVERSALYPAAWQPMPLEPLTIHSAYLIPAEDQVLKLGDILRIAIQGSPGAEASFSIGDRNNRVKMTELAYPAGPPGEGGIYTAAYRINGSDVSDSVISEPMRIFVSLRKGEEEVVRELPGRVRFLSATPYKIVEVKEEHELKNRGWLYVLRDSAFQLHAGTLGGAGYLTNVVSYLVEGTRYEAVGMSGNYYRVNLYGDQIFLIHKDNVRELEDKSALESSLSDIRLLKTGKKISLSLKATERFPFLVEDGINKLAVKLYGLGIDEDLTLPALPEIVNDLKLEVNTAESSDSMVLNIELDQNIAGFKSKWNGTKLVIDIYKPPTVSINDPLKDKIIIIDPGHGGKDSGAIGPGDIHEKDVVLAMGLHLKDLLTAEGATVIMTRTEDKFVNLYDRPERIDLYNADFFISIHANAHAHDAPATEIHGLMTLYNFAHNEELAEIMLSTMEEEMDLPAFRTWRRNIAVLRHPHIPSILVEAGYMMHPEDNWHILHPRGQKEFAKAMKEGIIKYFLSFAE